MVDPISTAAGIVVGKALSKKETEGLVSRLIGPALDVWGGQLAKWADQRKTNVDQIMEKAAGKLDGGIDTEGSVPGRIAGKLLEDGSWCDDMIMQEYLAGVLAGSRTPDGADDRGVYWTDLVSRLASMQVRTHFVLYSALRQACIAQQKNNPEIGMQQGAFAVFVPTNDICSSIGFTKAQFDAGGLTSAITTLVREGLLGAQWQVGADTWDKVAPPPGVERPADPILRHGVAVVPSHVGAELFMWAHGKSSGVISNLIDPGYALPDFSEYLVPPASARVGQFTG